MTRVEPILHFGLFVREQFFDERACAEIVAEMQSCQAESATVYGRGASGTIDGTARKSLRCAPNAETTLFVRQKLSECKAEVEEYFSRSLGEVEEPQFLRYGVGDFFVAHQDGNTGLLRLDSDARLVSVVILLSHGSEIRGGSENTYSGGALVFHDRHAYPLRAELSLARNPGTLIAFRSETTHEVTPVTNGERYSIASWYR